MTASMPKEVAAVLAGGARWAVVHGDCLDVLPRLPDGAATVIITDPVWPNARPDIFPGVDAWRVFSDAVRLVPRVASRLVVVLGSGSDPRFLADVPRELRFVRTCWLRYAVPSYAGTILNGADVAYVFGDHRAPPGAVVLPGEVSYNGAEPRDRGSDAHPCPRRLPHMAWLVRWFSKPGDVILDPFAGSGTTGLAAIRLGRRFIGVEIDAKYHALAVDRLRAEEDNSTLAASRAGQAALFGGAR